MRATFLQKAKAMANTPEATWTDLLDWIASFEDGKDIATNVKLVETDGPYCDTACPLWS